MRMEAPTVLMNENMNLYVTGALLKTEKFCFIDLKSNENIYVSAANKIVIVQTINLRRVNTIKKYIEVIKFNIRSVFMRNVTEKLSIKPFAKIIVPDAAKQK